MQQILKDYITIYQTEAIGSVQRKKQHQSVVEWLSKDYADTPSILELLSFLMVHNNIKFTKQFYDRLLFPHIRLSKDEYDVDALLMVFQKEVVNYYEEFLHYEVSTLKLENIVLAKYNNNKDVLEHRYKRQVRWFEYSIHEVQRGVLCGVNGASVEDIREMKKDLREFEELCLILNIDNHERICFILDIYDAYEQYLTSKNQYYSFKQYLEMKSSKY